MEKISRILPASPRVSSVDMRNSGTARPGAPSFGRPVGVSALASPRFDAMTRASDELKEFKSQREPTLSKDPKAQIVDKISREFFSRPAVTELNENGVDVAEEIVTHFHDGDSDLNPMTGKAALPSNEPVEVSEDAPLVGGQLDVMA